MLLIVITVLVFSYGLQKYLAANLDLEVIRMGWQWAWDLSKEEETKSMRPEWWTKFHHRKNRRITYLWQKADQLVSETKGNLGYWALSVTTGGAVVLMVYAYAWFLSAIWRGISRFMAGGIHVTPSSTAAASTSKITIMLIFMATAAVMMLYKAWKTQAGVDFFRYAGEHTSDTLTMNILKGVMEANREVDSDEKKRLNEIQKAQLIIAIQAKSPNGHSLAWTGVNLASIALLVLGAITILLFTLVKIKFIADLLKVLGVI